MATRSLLVCGLILVSIQLVLGHGFLQLPISRNYGAHLAGKEYCHHCLSSGGPSTVQSLTPGGLFPTPTESVTSAVRHTICGESAAVPASGRVYNPYPAPAVSGLPAYAPGQVIDITVVITAHHRGHFDFRLCDASKLADPSTVNWACMTTLLQRVSVPGEVSPVDVNHPERYYLEPECSPNYNKTITMKYQLPASLTCERCIMQWWWVSANTCNPPDYAQRSPQPAHVATGCDWWQSNLQPCGQSYPEEFFNCADIRIAGGSATPGTNTAPPPAQPVAAPVAAPAQPVAAPAVPKAAPKAAPKAPPATPKAPPAVPVAPPATPKAPPAAPKAPATPKAAPKAPIAPPKAPPAAPKTPTAPVDLSCAILGGQCGGDGWTGETCCQSGTCYKYLTTYSQCRQGSCPAGWICTGSKNQSTLASAVAWAKRFFA